ncbi:DUF5615 family PIN-like protein [Nostoc punctiforme UO1]|uniref:DUF5615 family PIN-like protein n=1 Tax=Nostoc punctiforme TaxID=272131 RepID=UPI0030A46EE1
MLRFLADENFNNQIVRGILRRNSNVDIVRLQDVGLTEADDPTVLEWAFSQYLMDLKFYGFKSSIVCSDRKSHYHQSSTTNYFCPIHGNGIIPP